LKNTKTIILLLFINLLLLSSFQAYSVDTPIETETERTVLPMDFIRDEDEVFNATITNFTRNMTIELDAKIVLEDRFELIFHDNDTKIGAINYSIPNEFAKHAVQVFAYSQIDTSAGLMSRNNLQPIIETTEPTLTTFTFNIKENQTLAQNTTTVVYMATKIIVSDSISFALNGTGLEGKFMIPVVPIFRGLNVKNANIHLALKAELDSFDISMNEKITNAENVEYPTANERDVSWLNFSRSSFNSIEGLQEDYDLAEITFKSLTRRETTLAAQSTTIPYSLDSITKIVQINPWGKVFVKEQLVVRHDGPITPDDDEYINLVYNLRKYTLSIPSDGQVIKLYDDIGPLNLRTRDDETSYPTTTTVSDGPSKDKLEVNFRNGILGGQTYTFFVEYEFNMTNVVSVEGDIYTLNSTLAGDYNVTAREINVIYQLPVGANFLNHSYTPSSKHVSYRSFSSTSRNQFSILQHIDIHIQLNNSNYIDNVGFQLTYQYAKGIGWGHIQYLITFLIAMISLISIIFLTTQLRFRSSKAIEVEKEEIPIGEIDTFFNLYREQAGANKRIVEIKDRRKRGKLSQKEYDGQVKSINKRLRELNGELELAVKDLSSKGIKYERLVDKIMIANQKQKDLRRNAQVARKAYKNGETAKDLYQKIMREYTRDIDKQETIINKSLSELLEIIQEY